MEINWQAADWRNEDYKAQPEEGVMLRVERMDKKHWQYWCFIGSKEIYPMHRARTCNEAKKLCTELYKRNKKKQTA